MIVFATLGLFVFVGPEFYKHFEGRSFRQLSDWFPAFGACSLIIISLSSAACKRFLSWAPIRSLGEISYSLYLWHFIVLLYCVHLLHSKLPLGAILCLVFALSLLVSWLSYRWIELPSIALGRKLTVANHAPQDRERSSDLRFRSR